MPELLVATTSLSPDEKAYGLSELNLVSPNGRSRRRYQLIHVQRNGRIAEYRRDMGLAKSFSTAQFRIPSLWEHTVGELQDIADHMRGEPTSLDEILEGAEYQKAKDKGRLIFNT